MGLFRNCTVRTSTKRTNFFCLLWISAETFAVFYESCAKPNEMQKHHRFELSGDDCNLTTCTRWTSAKDWDVDLRIHQYFFLFFRGLPHTPCLQWQHVMDSCSAQPTQLACCDYIRYVGNVTHKERRIRWGNRFLVPGKIRFASVFSGSKKLLFLLTCGTSVSLSPELEEEDLGLSRKKWRHEGNMFQKLSLIGGTSLWQTIGQGMTAPAFAERFRILSNAPDSYFQWASKEKGKNLQFSVLSSTSSGVNGWDNGFASKNHGGRLWQANVQTLDCAACTFNVVLVCHLLQKMCREAKISCHNAKWGQNHELSFKNAFSSSTKYFFWRQQTCWIKNPFLTFH